MNCSIVYWALPIAILLFILYLGILNLLFIFTVDKYHYKIYLYLKNVTMKQLKNWFVLIVFPILVFLIPEFVDVDTITQSFLNITGLAWITVTAVEAIKRVINYNPETAWKYLAQLIALITGVVVAGLGDILGLGLFVELDLQWWGVVLMGLFTAGYSMGWYDLEFFKLIVKVALGVDVKK